MVIVYIAVTILVALFFYVLRCRRQLCTVRAKSSLLS
jgi:hypothetical protein